MNSQQAYKVLELEPHDVLCSSEADPTDPTGRGWFTKYGLDKTALGSSTYARVASDFFEMIYNDEQFQRRIFHPLLMRVVGSCEEKALAMFRKMEKTKARKLYDILILYQDTLHLSADTLAKIRQIIEAQTLSEALDVEDIVVLNPDIDDLLNQSVYKLKRGDSETLFVPLWHRELEYDGVFVDCVPTLPDNIWLDVLNNIHVKCGFKVGDLWDKDGVDIQVGTRVYNLDVGLLRLVSKQTVRVDGDGQGIPVPNEADIFNVSRLSSVYAHVEIEI